MRTGPWFCLFLTGLLCCSLPLESADGLVADSLPYHQSVLRQSYQRLDGHKSGSARSVNICPVAGRVGSGDLIRHDNAWRPRKKLLTAIAAIDNDAPANET